MLTMSDVSPKHTAVRTVSPLAHGGQVRGMRLSCSSVNYLFCVWYISIYLYISHVVIGRLVYIVSIYLYYFRYVLTFLFIEYFSGRYGECWGVLRE